MKKGKDRTAANCLYCGGSAKDRNDSCTSAFHLLASFPAPKTPMGKLKSALSAHQRMCNELFILLDDPPKADSSECPVMRNYNLEILRVSVSSSLKIVFERLAEVESNPVARALDDVPTGHDNKNSS